MVSPCCIKYRCCKGKQAKTKNEKDDGEWFEPTRRKSRKKGQVSAQENIDTPQPTLPGKLDAPTLGAGAMGKSPNCVPSPPLSISSEYSQGSFSDNNDGTVNDGDGKDLQEGGHESVVLSYSEKFMSTRNIDHFLSDSERSLND